MLLENGGSSPDCQRPIFWLISGVNAVREAGRQHHLCRCKTFRKPHVLPQDRDHGVPERWPRIVDNEMSSSECLWLDGIKPSYARLQVTSAYKYTLLFISSDLSKQISTLKVNIELLASLLSTSSYPPKLHINFCLLQNEGC